MNGPMDSNKKLVIEQGNLRLNLFVPSLTHTICMLQLEQDCYDRS